MMRIAKSSLSLIHANIILNIKTVILSGSIEYFLFFIRLLEIIK